MICSAALADRGHDVFNTNTAPPQRLNPAPISGNAALGNNSPVARFFDAMDKEIVTRGPSDKDKVVLSQPFNKNVQRVQEWSNTTAKVAHQYRDIARILRAIPVPNGPGIAQSDLADYKKLTADWYDDSAEVMEDWIRPRPAASTREELQTQLDEMTQRSEALKTTNQQLQAMDKKLRDQFDVRPRDDALMTYVTRQRPKP